jgi:hypothetical protein
MVNFRDMSDNIVVTSDAAPPKKRAKASAKSDTSKPENLVEKIDNGKKIIFYSSGSGYVTKSGFKFTPQNRIYEIDAEEADRLLNLDNFRLPDQLELEEYYKEKNNGW